MNHSTPISVRHTALLLAVLGVLGVGTTVQANDAATPTAAQEPTSLTEAFKGGKVNLSLRYRYEGVDQDGIAKDAAASTLRTTLGFRSQPLHGFSLFLEAENVTAIGNELYRNAGAGSLGNGVTGRPVVADPALTEVNQAYIRYAAGTTRVDVGRQEINRGDQRFVGAVGWRQNHQSFDALSIDHAIEAGALGPVTVRYAYVDNANRIFGDNRGMNTHLLDVACTLSVGTLTAYGYQLDFDAASQATASTATFGIELRGERAVGKVTWRYEAEWAQQQDASDNPRSIDADYRHARLGVKMPTLTIEAGYELLEGEPGDGTFQTPLATLHKWNGWADQFLATPADGLVDTWLSLAGTFGGSLPITWKAIYHDFTADSSNRDFGTELDLQLTWKSTWKQVFGLKAAFYDADQHRQDTDKVWLWTQYTF